LASPSVKRVTDLSCRPTGDLQGKSLQKLLRQDKIKYERALALQKLERDPDGVYMELKYHLAWNVIYRGPVFMPNDDFFDFFHNTFLECSELVGGLVSLLGLAPDHVHLYLESDGKNSVETVVQEIKRFSKSALLSTFVDLKDGFEAGNELWDNAYFSETIG
jgi:putative transposase